MSLRAAVFGLLAATASSSPALARQVAPDLVESLAFREIGPANMSGRVVDLAVVERDPFTFYVATATGGVWKTTDRGVTFTPVFRDEAVHSVGAIAVHQRDTNVVWVGTGERANRQSSGWGNGVYRSTDGGTTWQHLGLDASLHIGRIALHPNNPDVAFVAAMGHLWGPNEERGLYRTTDGGRTWTRTLAVDEHTGVVDVAIDPADPTVMYAASYQRRRRPFGFDGGGPGSALWKSTDGGRTWRKLSRGLPAGEYGRIGISIYRSDPNIVYISLEQGWRYNASTAYTERRAGVYRSEDKGETWQHMGDWNPRPMYASQPLVDPNNDQRIYMMNSYSRSDDGGRTFRAIRHSLHGDDRIFWVNPADSRHVMKGDDGGLGISYDMGRTFLYVTNLPVSQFYRIAADLKDPYWVYGGLQDNGSWAGPNATFRSEGILFDDWFRTGGGDGFLSLVDTTDNRTLYVESQYLGLSRFDLVSRLRKSIRPGDPFGAISDRRNWDAWGPGTPEPELGNAMAPANWDGPFIISPHDHRTIYAGTNQLWKSTDQGDTWESLGDLTTGTNRRDLLIMGRRANDSTPSLDDGIPYWPTLTAIAESPLRRGVLYVGTDDGKFQVSMNDGREWVDASGNLPGLPEMAWINGVEVSRFDDAAVYVTVNNYRNDDYGNYVYRCVEFGQRCLSIVGDLPAARVARTLREDPRNPNVLWLGTEFGLFYTNDWGRHWMPLRNNLPTVAVNDLLIHPRDNDLILATHGRGVWILDQVNALQELTPEVLASDAHLFSIEPARMIRYANAKAHQGDMIFRGDNPPEGAPIDYFLAAGGGDIALTVHDDRGAEIARLDAPGEPGVNRVVWNLRHQSPLPRREGGGGGFFGGQTEGPWVLPGRYVVRLAVNGRTHEQAVVVREDPRVQVEDAERREWHATMIALAEHVRSFVPIADSLRALDQRIERLPPAERGRYDGLAERIDEIAGRVAEVRSRLTGLYGDMSGWPGTPTADQKTQMAYLAEWSARLTPGVRELLAAGNALRN